MLFNKNNNGSRELYELSGTFQASADFRAVASEIVSAQAEVAALVGAGVIGEAESVYAKETPTAAESAFLDMVRRPVAFLAISSYARLTGLSHGETGRKIKVDENEKVAFQWQIDRDDREMRERYYRSLDALFNYLNSGEHASWKESELYRMQSSTLVAGLSQLEKVFPVNHSSYTYYMLLPLFREAQSRLADIIGAARLAALLSGTDALGILDACRRYEVLYALTLALGRWSIAAFPLEVARQFSPSYQGNVERRVATTDEIDWTLGHLRAQLSEAEQELRVACGENPFSSAQLLPENDPKNKYFTV